MGRKRERTRIVSRMDELPDDIRVQIESMLLDKTISYKEIADWATDSGYPISKSAIGRYAQRIGRAAMRLNTPAKTRTRLLQRCRSIGALSFPTRRTRW